MQVLDSDSIEKKVLDMVSRARKSVYMASAWMRGSMVEKIVRNIPDNVDIKVVVRASEFRDMQITDDRVFSLFRERGAQIYINERLHAKFVVVDESEAVVGSANVTYSGYSVFETGNIEAAVHYTIEDDRQQIKELVDYFGKILEYSYPLNDSLVGYVINPSTTRSFRVVLLDNSIGEHSFVQVKSGGDNILGRVDSIVSYSAGFFNNPFEENDNIVYAPVNDFLNIFSHRRDIDWMRAAVYSYLNEKAQKVKVASVSIIGKVDDNGRISPINSPVDVGEPVYRSSEISKVLSVAQGSSRVRVGKVFGTDTDVFVNVDEILRKHMLVLGNTGSGKSHFVKLFLKRLAESEIPSLNVFILDPHGEYARAFEGMDENGKFRLDGIITWKFQNLFYLFNADAVIGFLKEYGLKVPRADSDNYKQLRKTVIDWLKEGKSSIKDEISGLIGGSDEFFAFLEDEYGKEFFERGNEFIRGLPNFINSQGVHVIDLTYVSDPWIRAHIAGRIMREIFLNAKEKSDYRALIVLEEAHNFAPESKYGDVSAGKDNPSLVYARKIASEGRKFGVGLITITQRPAQVSKYVLSQMNTQVMFRTVNAQDIDAISAYVEFAGEEILNILPSLKTGTGIMTGTALPFPVVVDVG